MSQNFPLPEKTSKTGAAHPTRPFHTSSFIIHPLFYAFRRGFRASAITHFFPYSRDESNGQDKLGGGQSTIPSVTLVPGLREDQIALSSKPDTIGKEMKLLYISLASFSGRSS